MNDEANKPDLGDLSRASRAVDEQEGDIDKIKKLLAKEQVKRIEAERNAETDDFLPMFNVRGLTNFFEKVVDTLIRTKKEIESLGPLTADEKKLIKDDKKIGFYGYNVMVIDMVGLKELNKINREKGDDALKEVAEAIGKFRRTTDGGARLGRGDEFALVTINSTKAELSTEMDRFLEGLPEGRDVYAVSGNFGPEDNLSSSLKLVMQKMEANKGNMQQDGTGRLTKGGTLILK